MPVFAVNFSLLTCLSIASCPLNTENRVFPTLLTPVFSLKYLKIIGMDRILCHRMPPVLKTDTRGNRTSSWKSYSQRHIQWLTGARDLCSAPSSVAVFHRYLNSFLQSKHSNLHMSLSYFIPCFPDHSCTLSKC